MQQVSELINTDNISVSFIEYKCKQWHSYDFWCPKSAIRGATPNRHSELKHEFTVS